MAPTGILEPPDQRLFKLAKTWVGIFIPQARAMIPKGYLGQWEMYKALSKVGYKVVGREWGDVYMRRGDSVISVFIGNPRLLERGWNLIRKIEVKMLKRQLRELGAVEEWELVKDASFVAIWLGREVNVAYYGKERIELGNVDKYSLYLYSIVLWANKDDGYLQLNVGVRNEYGFTTHMLHITYSLLSDGSIHREVYEDITWDFKPYLSREMVKITDAVLEVINEKAPVFDELLSQAGQLVIEALR
jgi:hypothetical protein